MKRSTPSEGSIPREFRFFASGRRKYMGLWKDKTRKDWRYAFQCLGQRYAGGGFQTKREAATAREGRRKEIKETQPAETVMAFSDLSNKYLDHAERKFVPDTYKRKAFACKRFIASQGDLPIDQITPLHIHTYLSTLPTNSSYNEHREELSTVFNWIKKTYSAQLPFLVNPCIAVDRMPEICKEKDIPTEEELLRIIAAAKPGDEKDLVLCCVHLLGRIDEILRLRWHEDINFEKRIVTLWTRKRKDGAYQSNPMPMDDALYAILRQRWKDRKQEKWVFFNPRGGAEKTGDRYFHRPKVMESICKRAGITPIGKGRRTLWRGKDKGKVVEAPLYFGFHSLRHFTATYLADQEQISLKTVSGLLRHKNLRTTEIYLHHLDPSHKAAISKMDELFKPKKVDPQASPASIKEKGSRNEP